MSIFEDDIRGKDEAIVAGSEVARSDVVISYGILSKAIDMVCIRQGSSRKYACVVVDRRDEQGAIAYMANVDVIDVEWCRVFMDDEHVVMDAEYGAYHAHDVPVMLNILQGDDHQEEVVGDVVGVIVVDEHDV